MPFYKGKSSTLGVPPVVTRRRVFARVSAGTSHLVRLPHPRDRDLREDCVDTKLLSDVLDGPLHGPPLVVDGVDVLTLGGLGGGRHVAHSHPEGSGVMHPTHGDPQRHTPGRVR